MIARRPRLHAPQARTRERGVALLEVLIAVLLLGIGLLGAIGLQARSYSALADTSMRAEATMAADKLIGVMMNDQKNLNAYSLTATGTPGATLLPWYNETRAHIPNAGITVTVTPPSATDPARVVVTIGWTRKAGGAANSHTVKAYLAPGLDQPL